VTTASFDTDVLARLVGAKRACLAQLRDLGERQFELIECGNTTALLDVLSAKQRPLIELQRIERALDPFRNQDPEKRRWRSPADRAACARLVAECEATLGEIVRREKQCESVLTRQRDEAAVRLQGLRTAGQACGAYTAMTHVQTSQLDLSSGT
jgi:hypothetical protein